MATTRVTVENYEADICCRQDNEENVCNSQLNGAVSIVHRLLFEATVSWIFGTKCSLWLFLFVEFGDVITGFSVPINI